MSRVAADTRPPFPSLPAGMLPARRSRSAQRGKPVGFSLLELILVLAILLVVASIFTPNVNTMMRDAAVGSGYETALMTLRRAREAAVAERRVYTVTFTAPNTVSIAPLTPDPTAITGTWTLPTGIQFLAQAGIPNTPATTPDGFGLGQGTGSIDFDVGIGPGGLNYVNFYPDGSARDINGNLNNGVVYISRPGDVLSSRAVTVWGASGRIRGWRLYSTGGVTAWSKQ